MPGSCLGLPTSSKIHGATTQIKGLDNARLKVTAVGFGEFFFAVAKQFDAERTRAGLRAVVGTETASSDGGGGGAFAEMLDDLVEFRRGEFAVENAVDFHGGVEHPVHFQVAERGDKNHRRAGREEETVEEGFSYFSR